MNNHLVIGAGDIGRRIIRVLMGEGQAGQHSAPSSASPVPSAVVRHASVDAARACGAVVSVIDFDTDEIPALAAKTVWYTVPPQRAGVTDERMRGVLAALQADHLVYISTSGVYGDADGAWIDEGFPTEPSNDRGRRRVDAELQARAWAVKAGAALTILRVPGIYGPGRMPVRRLQERLPVLRTSESPYTNRIHADDLAAICVAAASGPGGVFNVSDGNPTTMADYFCRCARLLNLPEPAQVSMEEAEQQLTPAMLSFLRDSKRLNNGKMLAELGVKLRYPTLELGLPSCLPRQ